MRNLNRIAEGLSLLANDRKPPESLHSRALPNFIERATLRSYLSAGALGRLVMVGGVTATAYIGRLAREGHPLRSAMLDGGLRYRLLDVLVRARSDDLPVTENPARPIEREISELDKELQALTKAAVNKRHELHIQSIAIKLTGDTLLREPEIASGRMPLRETCGVYFLLSGERVVYVGQSVNVALRLTEHKRTKEFDGYAFIPCEQAILGRLEALYIHFLRPPLNGITDGGLPYAPFKLHYLLEGQRPNTVSAMREWQKSRNYP